MNDSVPAPGEGSSRLTRRSKHVREACDECRRRKCRCDGEQPCCGPCLLSHHVCHYGGGHDRRTEVSKLREEIARLWQKVAALEAGQQELLASHARGCAMPTPAQDLAARSGFSPSSQTIAPTQAFRQSSFPRTQSEGVANGMNPVYEERLPQQHVHDAPGPLPLAWETGSIGSAARFGPVPGTSASALFFPGSASLVGDHSFGTLALPTYPISAEKYYPSVDASQPSADYIGFTSQAAPESHDGFGVNLDAIPRAS